MIKKNNSQDKCDLEPSAPWLDVPCISQPGFPPIGARSGTITGSGVAKYNADGSTSVTGTKIFTSHVIGPGEDIATMVQFDAISLLLPGADLSGGIKSRINAGGKVVLSVYSYNSSSAQGKGNILYRLSSATTSISDFIGTPEKIPSPFGSGTIGSDQVKTLLYGAQTWLVDPSRCASLNGPDLFTATTAYINGRTKPEETPLYDCLKGNNYVLLQPVIVEVEVTNATVMYHSGFVVYIKAIVRITAAGLLRNFILFPFHC